MYERFGLVLMVNHACNLRCDYCYTGDKFNRPMPEKVARRAIDRALASTSRRGVLELGFFGGEPLLEAELILRLIDYASDRSRAFGVDLQLDLTTNGTISSAAAWQLMSLPQITLAVSHDGLPDVHNWHRRFPDGRGSSDIVLATMRRLLSVGREFRTMTVVRPDSVELLPEGISFLMDFGVRRIDLGLDIWAYWSAEDARHLECALRRCADIWRNALPDVSINWFDEKAARLAGVPITETARCSFGAGEVAVAPSGRIYPCERLIGEDDPSNPVRLPGGVLDGKDFLGFEPAPCRSPQPCASCQFSSICSTTCRCSNYIRTGDVSAPDGLLCLRERACIQETARALEELRCVAVVPQD